MTTYHNDTIMVTRNGREIHVNADEETLIVGDVHAHNQEERSEIKGSVVVREGGRVVVNDMDVEDTIDGLSDEMASLRAMATEGGTGKLRSRAVSTACSATCTAAR